VEGRLSFLDFSIRRTATQFELGVFRKETHSNRYVSPYSCVAPGIIAGVMRSMRARALRYCTSQEALRREFLHLTNVFLANGYPLSKVRKIFNTRLVDELPLRAQGQERSGSQGPRACIPYWGRMSLALRSLLSAVGFQVSLTATANLDSMLFRRTLRHTPAPRLEGTRAADSMNVVYCIECTQCDSRYIGCTKRRFSCRLREHRQDTGGHTGLSEHAHNTGHGFQFQRYLYHARHESDLRFVEALYISANSEDDRPTPSPSRTLLNKQSDPRSRTLPAPWHAILHHFSTQ
jgi:hypothetical protein